MIVKPVLRLLVRHVVQAKSYEERSPKHCLRDSMESLEVHAQLRSVYPFQLSVYEAPPLHPSFPARDVDSLNLGNKHLRQCSRRLLMPSLLCYLGSSAPLGVSKLAVGSSLK